MFLPFLFIENIVSASSHVNVVDLHENKSYYRPTPQIITKYGDMDLISQKVIKTVLQQELKQGLKANPERVRTLAIGLGYEFRGYGARNLFKQCIRNLKSVSKKALFPLMLHKHIFTCNKIMLSQNRRIMNHF